MTRRPGSFFGSFGQVLAALAVGSPERSTLPAVGVIPNGRIAASRSITATGRFHQAGVNQRYVGHMIVCHLMERDQGASCPI
jgi:hypothetical protein